jgi:hypothetical protein
MDPHTIQDIKQEGATDSEAQEQLSSYPSQPLVSEPEPSYAHFLGAQFNAESFANSPDFYPTNHVLDHEHLGRVPSGGSVIDTNAVFDDSGRSFHGYKEGKYFLPNDAVMLLPIQARVLLTSRTGRARPPGFATCRAPTADGWEVELGSDRKPGVCARCCDWHRHLGVSIC